MKMPTLGLLVLCGAAIATAVSYDASVLTELLGMSRHGGEGIVAVSALLFSTVLLAIGAQGFIRQWRRTSLRAAA